MTAVSLEEAQARLEAKRAELAKLPKPEQPKPGRKFCVPPVQWPCPDCGTLMAGWKKPATAAGQRCYPCDRASIPLVVDGPASYRGVELSRRARVPLGDVLKVYGWPAQYRQTFAEYSYPRDPREGLSGLDLADDRALMATIRQHPWIMIQGDIGTGKTALGSHLMARLWRQGFEIHYRPGGSLPAVAWGREGPMPTGGALMVDDLEHGVTGAAWEAVAKVLLPWYATRRPLVVTTNHRLADLYESHAALADRLRSGLVLTLRGGSRR